MIWNLLKKIVPIPIKRVLRRTLQNVCDSARYRRLRKPFDRGSWRHVIFVCKGNICRSAFAEHYLRRDVSDGTHRIESCGLDVDQGLCSPPEAVCVAKEFELDLAMHRSKGLTSCDVHNADMILAMEFRQYQRLKALFPGEQWKIRLLRDFSPWPDCLLCNIEDPYGSNENEFRRCFKRLQRALDGLKAHMNIQENE